MRKGLGGKIVLAGRTAKQREKTGYAPEYAARSDDSEMTGETELKDIPFDGFFETAGGYTPLVRIIV